MDPSSSVPALEGLEVEAVEWLPSGSDAGLVRVRGRWTELERREPDLPALGLRRGEEQRRFESLPDARFGRDPAVWRATFLVPAVLMEPAPDELWLSWEDGVRAGLPAPAQTFQPPATPPSAPAEPERGGEVIDRAVLAEHRARRAEAAERAQAQRAAEALKAVEVLELRSAELERRLEALHEREAAPPPAASLPSASEAEDVSPVAATAEEEPEAIADVLPAGPPAAALATAVASVKRLRGQLDDHRQRLRRSELLRGADAVALATLREQAGRVATLESRLAAAERMLSEAVDAADAAGADALAVREQAAEQVLLARQRAAADAAAVREQTAAELAVARERGAASEAAVAEARGESEVAARDLATERMAHADTQERLAARERELGAIATELAGVRAELERVRRDAAGRAAQLDRRLAELDSALSAERRAHSSTATELETARAELAHAEAANRAESVARAALDEEIDRERLARDTLAAALDAGLSAEAGLRSELAGVQASEADLRSELAGAQASEAHLRTELSTAQSSQAELRAQLATAQALQEGMRAELATAQSSQAELRAQLADAEALRGELRMQLEQAQALQADLTISREQARADLTALQAEAAELRAALADSRTELAEARTRMAELASGHASVAEEAGSLQARIAELERDADADLARRDTEQAERSAAATRPAGDERQAVTANLDAAAAALRARPAEPPPVADVPEPVVAEPPPVADAPEPEVAEPPPVADVPEPEVAEPPPAADAPEPVVAEPPPVADVPEPEVAEPPPVAEPPAASAAPAIVPRPTVRPRIVTEAGHPTRADVVGSSRRDYPWLRGALVKLAHDDPRAATRLLLGLVPAQRGLLPDPVDYDLTIRGSGTYAINVGADGAVALPLAGPRPRREAAFHLAADIVTLTELLAGVEKRMGRWFGPVKVHGPRRRAEELRAALAGADLDLAAAARAGAALDPDIVFRAFAYAIHPSWTKGQRFTVLQEISDPSPQHWRVTVADGASVVVDRRGGAADAAVVLTRAAFAHLLRGEPIPSGARPTIRGDRAAVAALKAWTDRAQGRAG